MKKIKKERDVRLVRKYYRYSTGVAYGRYAARSPGCMAPSDDILLGLYRADGNGCLYEFKIEQHAFEKPTIRVCVFRDAFQAFQDFDWFFLWLRDYKPRDLDTVEAMLKDMGVVNGIQKERTH